MELLIYCVGSAMVFLLINVTLLVDRLSAEPLPREIISPEDYLGVLGFLTKVPAANTAVIVIFWSGIGLLAYTVVWALINATIEARNEIVVETEYVNKGRLWDRFRAPLLQAVVSIALFGSVLCVYKFLMPILLKRFSQIVIAADGPQFLALIIPIAVLTAVFTAISVLIRTARHHTRIAETIWH